MADGESVAQHLGGRVVLRPLDDPPHGVPVALRSITHCTVSRGRFTTPLSKRLVIAKWLISGGAQIGVGFQRVPFGPGEVAIYLPTIEHRFWATAPTNEMCWLSIDGPFAEQFVLQLHLRPGVFSYGPPPVEQLHVLMDSMGDHSVQGRRASSLLAMELWYQVANAIRTPEVPTVVRKIQHAIEQEFADPNFSAGQIAQKVGYHRGAVSRLFHRHTGVTIIDYLTQVRLQEARSLLLHTQEKVEEVGVKCGFREAPYFCRWFRRHTGTSPGEMRKAAKW